MGLLDFLSRQFPANHNEQLGPNDLPKDVFDDLTNTRPNNPRYQNDAHHGSFDQMENEFENAFHQMDSMFRSFLGGRSIFGGLPDGPFPESDNGHDMFRGFFRSGPVFGELPDGPISESDEDDHGMFQGFFGNRPHIEFFQGGPLIESDGNENSLRDKMLNNESENQVIVSPFQDNQSHSDRFMFKFNTPFFKNLWQSPFDRHMDDGIIKNDMIGNEDQDLDKEYEKGNYSIDNFLDSQNKPNDQSSLGLAKKSPSNSFSSVFKSTSVSKKINPDGSIETTSRKCDSDGNEEVVTSRIIGEQTHTVTTKKKHNGEEEQIESFMNMDGNDLEEFNSKWNQQKTKIFSSWWKPS